MPPVGSAIDYMSVSWGTGEVASRVAADFPAHAGDRATGRGTTRPTRIGRVVPVDSAGGQALRDFPSDVRIRDRLLDSK